MKLKKQTKFLSKSLLTLYKQKSIFIYTDKSQIPLTHLLTKEISEKNKINHDRTD